MQTLLIITGIVGFICVVIYYLSNRPSSGTRDERDTRIRSNEAGDLNYLAAKYQTKRVEANRDHTKALAGQVEASWTLETVSETKRRQEEEQIALHGNKLLVIAEANKFKLSPSSYESLKLQENAVQLKLLEAQGLKDIEWVYLEKEHKLELAGAMILAIKRQKELEGLMQMFETIVRRKHEIEQGNDSSVVKRQLTSRLDKNLQIIEAAMDGENRLLQEVDGKVS